MQRVFPLRGKRIRWRCDQDRIRAELARGSGIFDRFLGAQGAGTDDERDPAANSLLNEFHQRHALVFFLRVVFAGGAGGDDAVYPASDQEIDDFRQAIVVDAVIVQVWRNNGRINAFEFHNVVRVQDCAADISNASGSGLTKYSSRSRDSSQ